MLCGVVLSNWAWIWINCSIRLLLAALLPPDDVALLDELELLAGVVSATVEPSA